MNLTYNYTCECRLGFKKTNGSEYTEIVEVRCPDAESSFDLNCDGDEFLGTLTAKCPNSKTNEFNSNSGWNQRDAEPTSFWPSCQSKFIGY